MTHLKTAVFDIDGTLALMDKDTGVYTPLPGALDALATCRAAGLRVVSYTNGTLHHPDEYYEPLAKAGITLEPGHMMTPAVVAAHELRRMGTKRVMVLAAEGVTRPIEEAGIEVVPPAKGVGPVDGVLIGWTRDIDVPMLEACAEALWDGAPLFATSIAPFFASSKGRMLGISGTLVAGLRATTGAEFTLFGKPATAGLSITADLTGASPDQMLVVGDDPNLEIRMARAGGAAAIGVTTGVSDRAAFEAIEPEARAHVVLDTLEDFSLDLVKP